MIYIWTRRTADWTDEEAFRAQLTPDVAPLVDLWDRTFAMPFHLFRHEVRKIALDNQRQVDGAIHADFDDIPNGALVIPTDDDDWFAPYAARVLEEHQGDGAPGRRWLSSWVEVKQDLEHVFFTTARRILPGVGQKWTCTTNNYALVKRDDNRELLNRHTFASRWVEADPSRAPLIDRRLSIANRTLASITSLKRVRRPVGPRALRRKYARYRKLYRRPLPHEELAWAQPYVERMAVLMERLELR